MGPETLSSPVFCAIDTVSLDAAMGLATSVLDIVGGLKLGLEFYSAHGPEGVRRVAGLGMPVFLDMKLHDIPNTVAGAIRALVPLQPAFVTLHASGGRAMLEEAAAAARETAEELQVPRPRLLGVTVLTSLDEDDLRDVGQDPEPHHQVDRLATLAMEANLDGVVCSSHEIEHLRRRFGPHFLLVVPGIRPSWAGSDDQKRVMTPAEAMAKGADVLVIGRPITRATDPSAAARQVAYELTEGRCGPANRP
ncbi:MAG: orotidine-5'-phosphate decarboxylase [Rhodospirillaceae bacterium]|nr:orotidine-5'-phosphate decarboxylase [Rhodospirillaceae bacterium]